MKADTADLYWDKIWGDKVVNSKWLNPEPDVGKWARGLHKGANILDLGAGVGRHAISLHTAGFNVTVKTSCMQ